MLLSLLAVISSVVVVATEPDCEVLSRYAVASRNAPQEPAARTQFLTTWRSALTDALAGIPTSDCRTRVASAVLSIHYGLGDYGRARDFAESLLNEASSREDRLFAANMLIASIHQVSGENMSVDMLQVCRQAAQQGLVGWTTFEESIDSRQLPGAFRSHAFLEHVVASTEPSPDACIDALDALESRLRAVDVGGQLAEARDNEVKTIQYERRLKKFLNGRDSEVFDELRSLHDNFNGRVAAALALLNRCGDVHGARGKEAIEQFILDETSDVVTRFQIAQGVAMRLYKAIADQQVPDIAQCETYLIASQRIQRLLLELEQIDVRSIVPLEHAVPLAVQQTVWADSLYVDIQVLKYRIRDDARATQRAIEFLARFPNHERVQEVRDDVGL